MKKNKLAGIRMLFVLISGLVIWNCSGNSITAVEKSGTELILNGDMEKGNPPADWNANGATLSADSDSHSGKQSIKISPSVNLGRAAQNIPVKPNTKYRFEFWYKCTTDVSGLYFYADANKIIYADIKSDKTWTRWIGEFDTANASVPATTVGIGFCAWPGGDILIDDVSITEDIAGERVIKARKDWQLLFPGRKYICWDKNPWDKLAKVQFPPSVERPGYKFPFQECKNINLTMGGNEYESASFVLTNLSDKTAEFVISTKDAGIPITIRKALWVITYSGKEVNDALPLLEGSLSIPSGESREVWLTLYSRGVKPGNYNPRIVITPQGLPPFSVNLKVKVYPVSLPDDKPIYTYYWDYLVPEWTTPERAESIIADMKAHYVSVPMVHPWVDKLCIPGGKPEFNSDGNLKLDFTKLDELLNYYQRLNPKMVIFTWNPDAYLAKIPGFEFFSEEWKSLFESYLTGLVTHLKETGWSYDRFAIIPYDERIDKQVYDMAKLIKEIDPEIQLGADPYNTTLFNLTPYGELASYLDIYMPFLYNHINMGSFEWLNFSTEKLSSMHFWTYANTHNILPQDSSPYANYRLALWHAWQEGITGFGYWVYAYKTHWNQYMHEDGENWSVVYEANDKDAPPGLSKKELVVTSKRWEATREGVEDYVYLYLLKNAISKAGKAVSPESLAEAKKVLAESPKTVLGEMKNTALADKAKEDILKTISTISPTTH